MEIRHPHRWSVEGWRAVLTFHEKNEDAVGFHLHEFNRSFSATSRRRWCWKCVSCTTTKKYIIELRERAAQTHGSDKSSIETTECLATEMKRVKSSQLATGMYNIVVHLMSHFYRRPSYTQCSRSCAIRASNNREEKRELHECERDIFKLNSFRNPTLFA